MDCHGAGKGWTFNSLIPERLDPACEFVVQDEWTEYTEFLEEGCDAALFVGMHARAGTRDGVMNHTVSGRDFQNLWFNGDARRRDGHQRRALRDLGLPGAPRHGRRRVVSRGDGAARRRAHDGRREARLQLASARETSRRLRARELIEDGARAGARPTCRPSRRTTRAARARSRSSTRTRTPPDALRFRPASSASTTARSSPAPTRGGRPGSSSTSRSSPMSYVPVAVRSYEAFARGDMDAVLADMHVDIEWHQAQGLAARRRLPRGRRGSPQRLRPARP